jgi:stage V sporulation protein R
VSGRFLSRDSEWSFELIERYEQEIGRLAAEYRLDTYPNQIEVVSAEQMMDAYASVGMPVGYTHWSYGREFLAVESRYRRGEMGLAYELVINSNPCIAYLMEENTITMQALVIAHASYGHNSFFKGNYLFRAWTTADAIVDYLVYARHFIEECESRHGETAVEELLDSCHALMNYGVDRYKRPARLSAEQERLRLDERERYRQSQVDDLWRTLPQRAEAKLPAEAERYPREPQENILYFIEKNAPNLESWQREIVRIVRKLAQYFYPQRQTQVMNEGWATFWHYTLLNRLYDEGRVDDGFMIEFLTSHTNVLSQPGFDSKRYGGINPYALGFAMMSDIRRICEKPTDEDREWFPDIAGQDWLSTLDFAMRNFKDESFIAQYLSPRIIREMRLFAVVDDDLQGESEVSAIHDDAGYRHVRQALASQYDLGLREPDIQVHAIDRRGDRSLTLRHRRQQRRPLAANADEVLKHVARLWGFVVRLEAEHEGQVELIGEVRPAH